jgi:hypothetical protein
MGYSMNMGSRQKNDPNNFSQKDQGTINQAPNAITNIVRKIKFSKSGPYNFAKNILSVGAALLPVPFIGKKKVAKQVIPQAAAVARQLRTNPKLKSIMENTVYQKNAKLGNPNISKILNNSRSSKDRIQSNIDKRIQNLVSNVPKVQGGYVPKGYKSYSQNMPEYRVKGKLYGHYTKEGKLTNKFIKKGK